ncbi:MAG TPA: efflux RND transporter permease subunit [Oligoflexus sp.]|uniref:efflux RND transporter permease subunit n=1 Tax=Oligoflexus sp. TaxID=1971216 RepID=UPI002D7F5ED1|nr:efflux RND transporter permease subunit [Oligoflexus sp.]HET9240111.1 efflux RND transporter permease subunit [Oligoflexus sp.]
MLTAIIRYSLNHRLTILGLLLAICAYGLVVAQKLPVDVLPNLNRPTVAVLAEAHGLAPEEVESLVTVPIESVLNGAPGVLRVRSSSGIGIAILHVEFDWGTEIFHNRQLIAERLQLLQGRLPPGIIPVMGPVTSIMGEIQFVGVTAADGSSSPMDLRSYADWTLRPQLMTIPGISQVIVMGGEVKQYQILVSSQALQKRGISLEQFKEALHEVSENTTGGFLDIGDKEFLIRPLGRVTSLDDIKDSVVGMHFGQPVFIRDVAEVKLGARLKRGEGSINGKHSVILTIQKQPNASTIDLTAQIDKKLDELTPSIPNGIRIEKNLFRQAHFIETAIDNVKEALRDGIIMVAVILFLFLLNIRTTAITLVAIPVSLITTAIVFHLVGLGVNTMTLGGLAVAIGELVDDAIVDVENVFRRLRENKLSASPQNPLQVIYAASSEVRNSIVISTVIVCLVFLPLFALGGIEGRLFVPLGIAYIISILASLVISLTITPVLCSYFLPQSKAIAHGEDGFFVRMLKQIARRIVTFTMPRPWLVFGVSIGLLVFALSLIPKMGRNFLPNFNEGTATIGVAGAPGISLAASDKLGIKVEEAILSVPEVASTVRRTGRAEMDEHAEGVHWHEIDVDFKEGGRPRPIVLKEIREKIEATGDVYVNLGQPIGHRLDHLLSGVRAQIAVKIFGPELSELRRLAGETYGLLEKIPGVVDLQVEPLVLIPQLKIAVDRDEAGKVGIKSGALAEDLEIALNGESAGQFIEGQRIHDIFMRLDDESRASPESIGSTLIKVLPSGQGVTLADVSRIYQGSGPNMINREDMQRRIVVSANTQGRDLGTTVQDIQKKLSELTLPAGYFIKLGGQFESQQQASQRILVLGLLSLLGIFTVLYLHFRSWILSIQVMLNIPLALIGSVLAIYMTERVLSVATLIAFITLCGIASRNGILMVSHYLHLMKEEGETFGKDMILRGTLERLVPVLMTASTAALALIPLLLAAGEPGKEILHPVAVVIVGGLVSSTFLDLIVTPTAFYLFGQKASEQYLRFQANQGELL